VERLAFFPVGLVSLIPVIGAVVIIGLVGVSPPMAVGEQTGDTIQLCRGRRDLLGAVRKCYELTSVVVPLQPDVALDIQGADVDDVRTGMPSFGAAQQIGMDVEILKTSAQLSGRSSRHLRDAQQLERIRLLGQVVINKPDRLRVS
jgi:hypothetical protein